jgi:hypothetical protein
VSSAVCTPCAAKEGALQGATACWPGLAGKQISLTVAVSRCHCHSVTVTATLSVTMLRAVLGL